MDEGARHSESANQAVFRLDVAVNKVDRMDVLYPVKELRSISLEYPKKISDSIKPRFVFFLLPEVCCTSKNFQKDMGLPFCTLDIMKD